MPSEAQAPSEANQRLLRRYTSVWQVSAHARAHSRTTAGGVNHKTPSEALLIVADNTTLPQRVKIHPST